MDKISLTPVALFKCNEKDPLEAPRQGALNPDVSGEVIFSNEINRDCFEDLQGFSHIWLVYLFHKIEGWRPKVRPPRGEKKRGVFSTRSPYRPNPIGITPVKLIEVKKDRLIVSSHDLINGTPILDIKPYLSYSDRIEDIQQGWLEEHPLLDVRFSAQAEEKIQWLSQELDLNLANIISNQLMSEPTNSKIKRVQSQGNGFVLSYRTWRIEFLVSQRGVQVENIASGYDQNEILSEEDPHGDKKNHKKFLSTFDDQ